VLAFQLAVGLGEGRVAFQQGGVDDRLLGVVVVVDGALVAGVPVGQCPQPGDVGRLGGTD
jgi:hypothetical protein